MKNLSPTAQAVMDAYMDEYRAGRLAVAAALRAAAEYPVDIPPEIQGDAYWPYRNGMDKLRERFLSIANELASQP